MDTSASLPRRLRERCDEADGERLVALELMNRAVVGSAAGVDRCRREVKASARLRPRLLL